MEDKIKDLPYEVAIVVDSQTGKVVFSKQGQQTSVGFNAKEVSMMKGRIVTHNHPNVGNWGKEDARSQGFSFSPADVRSGAFGEMAEIRAVSSGYRHSLKPPNQGWNYDYWKESVNPVYQAQEKSVKDEFVDKILSGRMPVDVAERDYHHEVIRRTAEKTGMKYRREKI